MIWAMRGSRVWINTSTVTSRSGVNTKTCPKALSVHFSAQLRYAGATRRCRMSTSSRRP